MGWLPFIVEVIANTGGKSCCTDCAEIAGTFCVGHHRKGICAGGVIEALALIIGEEE
jgi:hypothetical protein